MKCSFALSVILVATFAILPTAFAEDEKAPAPSPSPARAKERVVVVGDGVARFHVERDVATRRMTFRLADPAVRIETNPVVLVPAGESPREVKLVAVEGQPGVWTWTDDAVAADRFDGTLRIVVGGRTYSSPLASVWAVEARHTLRYSGRLLTLPECGAEVEAVQDPRTGSLTIYSFEDVVVSEAPVIVVSQATKPVLVTMTPVAGKKGAWMVTHESLRTVTTSAHIRLVVNGKPCEAPLSFAPRGGRLLPVTGGPTWEVVRDTRAGYTTFYALDETLDGRVYTIDNPRLVYGGRTYPMTAVTGEPRAWRVIGLDTAGSTSSDGQLNFTLLGKTLSARVGLSGLGLDLR